MRLHQIRALSLKSPDGSDGGDDPVPPETELQDNPAYLPYTGADAWSVILTGMLWRHLLQVVSRNGFHFEMEATLKFSLLTIGVRSVLASDTFMTPAVWTEITLPQSERNFGIFICK